VKILREYGIALGATDPAEFVTLLMQHQDALMRYIRPLVGSFADAQDVLQETATALWKKHGEYDPERSFLPWAKKFARNEILMHHRRNRKYTFLTEPLIESLLEDQSRIEEQREERRRALQKCLQTLPEADRELIDLRYAERDLTIQQLADESGQTANVLYKSLGRIRQQLMECIKHRLAAGLS
jgi:RNA polymerase sigma-70 factor (ECF subfamily)